MNRLLGFSVFLSLPSERNSSLRLLLLLVSLLLLAEATPVDASVTKTKIAGAANWSDPGTWLQLRTGTINCSSSSRNVSGSTTTAFRSELQVGDILILNSGAVVLGTVASIVDDHHLTLLNYANASTSGSYGRQAVPASTDDVQIGNAAVSGAINLLLDIPDVTVNSITFISSDKANALTQSPGTTLIVKRDVVLNQPTANAVTVAWKINAGTASVGGGVTLGGAPNSIQPSRVAQVVITSGTLSIAGTLMFECYATDAPAAVDVLDLSGGPATLNLSGSFSINNGRGTLLPGAESTVNFTGSAPHTIPFGVSSVVYHHVRFSNSSVYGATLGAPITPARVLGNVSVDSGLLNNNGCSITLAPGKHFTLGPGAVFNLTETSSMPTVGTGGAKVLDPASTVAYAGANQEISPEAYGTLLISGSGTKRVGPGVMSVAGTFGIGDGVLVDLDYSGAVPIGALTIAGVAKAAGLWGSDPSLARVDAHFTGAGFLTVATGPQSSIALASSANASSYGQAVTFTAQVSGPAGARPSGVVQFLIDGLAVGPGIPVSGDGTATHEPIASLAAGVHHVTATYSGDPNLSDSTTATPLAQTVSPAVARITLACLCQTYDGAPKEPSAETLPPGLAVAFEYSGSMGPPTDAGEYPVNVSVQEPNYTGCVSGTLQILPAVTGRLELDGFAADRAIVTFALTDRATLLARLEHVELTREGADTGFRYRIGVLPGSRQVSVVSEGYLRRKLPLVFENGNPNQATVDFAGCGHDGDLDHRLFGGDLNHDNKINAADYFLLRDRWGTRDALADIDHDGSVGPEDYLILKKGWYRVGDEE